MFLEFFQLIVFLMGLVAVLLAIYFIRFFSRSKKPLSIAMMAFLIEQVLSSAGTMIFSSNSLLATLLGRDPEEWNSIDPWFAILIRFVMFGAMLHSTIRLSVEVKKINDQMESQE